MRLAIIAASSYAKNGKLPELSHAPSQAELFSQRLAEPDAAFTVQPVAAERGFSEGLEQFLASSPEPIESLLFFFSGYAAVSDEGFPGLLLDGERLSTVSLQRLRRLLSSRARSSFVILDTVSAFEEHRSDEMVHLFNHVLSGEQSGIHLCAAHAGGADRGAGPSPFTSLLAMTLDWHASAHGLSPEELFAAMNREEALFSRIPSVGFFRSTVPFQLLLPEVSRVVSAPPPMGVPEPSGDERETRAATMLASGDVEAALGELARALEQLGAAPTPHHATLYAKIGAALRAASRDDDARAYFDAALELEPNLAPALEAAADLALARGDRAKTVELLQRRLAVDPDAWDAADRIAHVFSEEQRWEELTTLYESVLARASDATVAVELALKIDALCRDFLKKPGRAAASLERAAGLAPDNAGLQFRLAQIYEARHEFAAALAHLSVGLRAEPGRIDGYRTALNLFQRTHRADAAWHAACALEALGAADVNESLLASAHRPEGLIPARDCLGDGPWIERLFCPERDALVDRLLNTIGDQAIVEIGVETARRKRRLVATDPATEQDPNTSTTTLLKTLAWSARLLSIPVPRVHVDPALQAPFVVIPAPEPTVVVSRSLGSGLGMPELAFLWSRQLTAFRPEHRASSFFPSAPELSALAEAALSLGGAAYLPFKRLDGDAKLFARALKRYLSPRAANELDELVRLLPAAEIGARVASWAKAVELAAGRVGLLASGDPELAVGLIRRFPLAGSTTADEQIKDVLAYSISDEYGLLRERLGLAIRA